MPLLALPMPGRFAELDAVALDALLLAMPRPAAAAPVLVVEIDRASLAALGPWPWPRARLAQAIALMTEAAPAAVLVDLLIEGPDRAGPAALAARLAEALQAEPETAAEGAALAARAALLPDHDRSLASVAAAGPVALGFVLAPEPSAPPAGPGGFATLGGGDYRPLSAPGAVVPPFAVPGLGAISLAGGLVRSVPLAVRVADEWQPGLVLEGLRLALDAGSPLLDLTRGEIRLGPAVLPVDAALSIRLHEAGAARRAARSVSAEALLAGEVPAGRIAGHIVVFGGAAPELGALRETPFAPLTPSVQIQAEALEQALALWLPRRPGGIETAEWLAAMPVAAIGAALGAMLAPAAALGSVVLLGLLMVAGALAALHGALLLVSPALPLLSLGLAALVGATAAFAAMRASRARLAARFAQSLPPAVVARIAAEPGLLRIGGERRVMSFVFTDIAGFTGLVERAGPESLIALLDAYIAGAAEIVAAEGGTLDKVVGDALHVMFGAPLDQPDHARRALACGEALAAFGTRFAAGDAARLAGFGKTRVGIATGAAVVGDVGGGRVLDYTAHGDAVNLAARLEQANKLFGTAVLLDAPTAAGCPGARLRPVARLAARGRRAAVDVFTPWAGTEAGLVAWHDLHARLGAGETDAPLRDALAAMADDPVAAFFLGRIDRGVAGVEVEQG